MNIRPLSQLRFLCVSMLTLFVIGLDFAWALGLGPISIPKIDGAFCGQDVMRYAPVGTNLSFDPSNSYAQCGKSIVDYTWNFGDGNTHSSVFPYPVLHSYSSPGLYVPTLTVTDSEGLSDTSHGYVTAFKGEILATSDSRMNLQDSGVAASPPAAPASTGGTTATIRYKVLPTNINPAFSPISVTLKIKQSGTEVRSISLSRLTGERQTSWDGRNNGGGLVSGGIYVATLEVVGGTNTHVSNGHQISVFTPPVAHIKDGIVAYQNTKVTFDGSGSYDPDDGTGSGLGISAWSWSFEGGVPASVTTTTSGASTTYSTLGEKTVTLTVTDYEGDTDTINRTISVTPATPVADAGENQTVYIGTAVSFDGSGSHKPGGGDLTYLWSFGDASPATTGSGVNPSHTYSTPGAKTVSLTVTDNEENTDSDTCTVTVIELTAVLEPVDNFSGRSNSRYGLAEVINLSFTIKPTGITAAEVGGLRWDKLSGSGLVDDSDEGTGLATFTAATTAGSVTLKLEIKNGSMSGKGPTRTIEVIAPSGVYLIKQPGTVTAHLQGYFSVGFIGWVYLLPRDVSFDNLTVSEGEDPPSVDGYFLPDSGENHTVGRWSGVGPGNIINGCKVELPDFIGILRTRTPYSPGNFKWQIPWRVGTKNGVLIKQFASVLQHFYSLDSSGDAHVKKGAGPFTARLNDPTARPPGWYGW